MTIKEWINRMERRKKWSLVISNACAQYIGYFGHKCAEQVLSAIRIAFIDSSCAPIGPVFEKKIRWLSSGSIDWKIIRQ